MKRLQLDWDGVLGKGSEEEEPPTLVIVSASRSLPAARVMSASGADRQARIEAMGDGDIERTIKRIKCNISGASSSLPDKGAQLMSFLKSLEEEQSRRKLGHSNAITKGDVRKSAENSVKSMSSGVHAISGNVKKEIEPSKDCEQSEFGSIFLKKMKDHNGTESSALAENRSNVSMSKNRFSKRKKKFRSLNSTMSSTKFKMKASDENAETFPTNSLDKESPNVKDADSKQFSTVVVVDEDDNADAAGPAEETLESLKIAKIYYPSRNCSESVEICYSDISCLEPRAYLTSPIMNFYIRYLQLHGSSPDNKFCNYHFFNTFFYEKLKQALSHEGHDRLSFFAKFRRWWKGVDIYEKAYVLIPINEDQHWSLVIVCIPDKEDESGPIILHLDSLGHHCSMSVFENIRRYLTKEWEFINQDVAPSNVPIADEIWKHLPRRIEDKILSVPQQKNYYDCGLFVLFFMQRFLEEAPERLKKRNLSMFGRRWFKPEQASRLREKIQRLLEDEFDKINNGGSSS